MVFVPGGSTSMEDWDLPVLSRASSHLSQIFVSRTVRDLVVGSRIGFATRGEFTSKGVSGQWELLEVTSLPSS